MISTRRLRANRDKLDTAQKPYLKYFTPVSFANRRYNRLCLQHFSRGRLLDAGAGHLRNKPLAVDHCDRYESMDLEPVSDDLDFTGDIQEMTGVPSDRYDTVLMTHVLEHLPRPGDALKECQRVLNSAGTLIGSTPHLSRLHGKPHDYFRFTQYGLAYLLRDVAGFKEAAVFPAGGLLTFLGHQYCTVFVCSMLHIPIIGDLTARFNHAVNIPLILALDKWFGAQSVMACMYFFLATNGSFASKQRAFLQGLPGVLWASAE